MSVRRLALVILSALAILPVAAGAHHGWSSYNSETPLYISGTLEKVVWSNPHPSVTVAVAGEEKVPAELPLPDALAKLAGVDQLMAKIRPAPAGSWSIDLAPLSRLSSVGWSEAPAQGSRIALVAVPKCDGSKVGRAFLAVLPDGRSFALQSFGLPSGTC